MTPDAIRKALEEIKALERLHAARALGAAFRAGGDLDDLDNARLETKRQARCLSC
jgi:hypothetical protein